MVLVWPELTCHGGKTYLAVVRRLRFLSRDFGVDPATLFAVVVAVFVPMS